MFRRRYERFRTSVDEADPITRLISLVAFMVLIVISLPTIGPTIPGVANGATCSRLYSPPGNGTQQSILSRNAGANALALQLSADVPMIRPGEALYLKIHFLNQSADPITFAFVPEEAVLRFSNSETGLMFAVGAPDGRLLAEPPGVKPPAPNRDSFSPETLHVLNPHEHCVQTIIFSTDRVNAAGLTAGGQYQIKAIYRQTARGIVPAIGNLTPTPIFPDQGVWVTTAAGIQSNTITIGYGVTPIPGS